MKKQTYEQAVHRLEEIVTALEEGSLPLEDSIKLFEEGTALAGWCSKTLDQAEQKITQLPEEEPEEREARA